MTGMTRRQAVAALGASTLVGGLGGATEETLASEPPSPRELLQQRHLPNVELFTQYGDRVRFYDDLVKDKKVMINFMYSRCTGICSPVTSNMVQVCRLLGDRVGTDISMYSITLTPRQDPPRVLRNYAQSHGVGPGWLFLTGDPKDVESLRQGLGFTFEDPVEDADRDQHIGMLRYGNEPLMRWAGCPALAPAEHVARTILWEFGDPSEIVSTPAGQVPSARAPRAT
jgi:protein SCO1/2